MLIICCFAHPCPLYDACSGSWGKDEKSIAPGMILALPPNTTDCCENSPPHEAQQLLATKDQNGKVNHVIINGSHEPV